MAASMALRLFQGRVSMNPIFTANTKLIRPYSVIAEASESEDSLYPPIQPRFPPGKWGNIPDHRAWKYHERGQELLKIPRVKERLENLAGDEPRFLQSVRSYDKWPRTLYYKKYITKTHVIDGLPELITGIELESESSNNVYRLANAAAKFETDDKVGVDRDDSIDKLKRVIRQILNAIHVALSTQQDHLLNSQVDENVRLETFWSRGGFGEEIVGKGKLRDMFTMQFKDKIDFQLRNELPLPQFVSQHDNLCLNTDFPSITYGPSAIGQDRVHDRPINISGHWIGDPCEFSLLACHVMPTEVKQFAKDMGEKLAVEQMIQFGLTASFASCLAQAYNQGFTEYFDVTYPFTTQTMITDGDKVRFLVYQMNTMQLWKDNEGNPLQNLCWLSENMPLYTNDVTSSKRCLNKEVADSIIRCLMVSPAQRNVDLRPYLPNEEGSSKIPAFINKKGEDPIQHEKIGRCQYPRNSVYF